MLTNKPLSEQQRYNEPPRLRRVGRFVIPTVMVANYEDSLADTLSQMRFIPLRVECRMDIEGYEMVGLSELFEPVTQYQKIPFYELRILTFPDGRKVIECNQAVDIV